MLPYPLPGPFDYRVPAGMDPQPGDVVLVPLNRREEVGVVWDAAPTRRVPDAQAEADAGVIDTPPMRADAAPVRRLGGRLHLAPPGEVMAHGVARVAPGIGRAGGRLGDVPSRRPTPAADRGAPACAGARWRDTSRAPPATWRARQASAPVWCAAWRMRDCWLPPLLPVDHRSRSPTLSIRGRSCPRTRQAAAAALRQAVGGTCFSVTLLDGVTGSGKTEVYLEAVAECLRHGRQALVLLPEIALSSQWLERFERRFGVAPAVWHSDLTSARRGAMTWRGGGRRARRRWWSARARRCSCRFPTLAWW